jgi:hypothetical protein
MALDRARRVGDPHLRRCMLRHPHPALPRKRPQAGEVAQRCGASAPYAAGTGSAVTDLIFSIANREVTFFSGTAPISFL